VPQSGPLPGSYGKDDLPVLERRLGAGELSLRGVNPRVLELDERLLANANTPAALSELSLEQDLPARDEHPA
jgi:hypothetical protein